MHETNWIKRYIAPLVTADGADHLRDDVAVLTSKGSTIATMDTLVEGIHFLSEDPLDTVGQKLVRVNVSDIRAKGAQPLEALLSIAWPRGWSDHDFGELIAGIGRDLKTFNIALIGGDLVGIEGPLTLTMTMTGKCLGPAPIRRSTGQAGQSLFVNGEIGWGGLGLKAALGQGPQQVAQRYRVPVMSPESAAEQVAAHAAASMDISDGLLIDASRLAQASGCGVEIALDQVPLAEPSEDIDAILAQCTSGDDYRILISCDETEVLSGFTRIGHLTPEPGLRLTYQGRPVNPPSTLGFEH